MKVMTNPNRREFLSAAGGFVAAGAVAAHRPEPPSTLKIGLIADPHHGLAPDAEMRLDAFMAAVADRKPDMLIQMGDFCHPPRAVKSASSFLRAFEAFRGPRYHVLGNHDLDLARNKREILDVWGADKSFYSFDRGGFHFVVLDCNFVRDRDGKCIDWSPNHKYEGRISPEQITWLKDDLEKTVYPTIVISHQGFGPKTSGGVVPNGEEVRAVIAAANKREKAGKVVLCMHGHNHMDGATVVEGVHYLQLNSASYLWVGEEYGRMAPYSDPLFAFMEFDPAGVIRLTGKASTFRKPTPTERGYPNPEAVSAYIASREFRFTPPTSI
jgi:3',5'-cyclic AMP phosphodiesterase CpdA